MTRLIPLHRGRQNEITGLSAVVDDSDYEWLLTLGPWKLQQSADRLISYAAIRLKRGSPHRTTLMHRVITGVADGLQIDHIDGDGLNNRRENLREVTHAQNMQNRKPPKHGKSPYRGVQVGNKPGKWRARVRVNGVTHRLGTFDDELEAARVAAEFRASVFAFTNPERDVRE